MVASVALRAQSRVTGVVPPVLCRQMHLPLTLVRCLTMLVVKGVETQVNSGHDALPKIIPRSGIA